MTLERSLRMCALRSLHCNGKWQPIDSRKFGYDVNVRPPVHTGWQGGTKQTLQGWGWGIQDMQLAFVLAKREPVHLEAANGVFQVKIFSFVCLTYDKKL